MAILKQTTHLLCVIDEEKSKDQGCQTTIDTVHDFVVAGGVVGDHAGPAEEEENHDQHKQ